MTRRRRSHVRTSGGFQPPCCPNPRCPFHLPQPHWHFVRNGYRQRRSDGRRFQIYRCSHCLRRFCSATFAPTYWLRRRDLLLPIARLISEGPALRQIARVLNTSHDTVARHVARLARHCLLFHRRTLQHLPISEPLVIDGFESFEFSQFFPFHANLATGANSWFLYHFTDSPLRRKGAMTPRQRSRRQLLEHTLGCPDPKAVELGIFLLLKPLLTTPPLASPLILHSDDHPAYPRALRRLHRQSPTPLAVSHRITSSTQRRTQSNPLFPTNLADLLLRHANANHRRETIAFSKRRQAALERLAVFTVWRNYIKQQRENGPKKSAAMCLGLVDRLLGWHHVLRRRLFPQHIQLPHPWDDYYWRKVKTPVLGPHQTEHSCGYAF